jgi:hypothetical protein
MKHLNPIRRAIETVMALYAVGFGVFIIFTIDAGLGSPLWWVGLDQNAQVLFALAMVFAGFIHAMGISINGSWRWSPLLRLIGMVTHATGVTYLVVAMIGSIGPPHGLPSGLYTYTVTAGLFWYLSCKAFVDLQNSLKLWAIYSVKL